MLHSLYRDAGLARTHKAIKADVDRAAPKGGEFDLATFFTMLCTGDFQLSLQPACRDEVLRLLRGVEPPRLCFRLATLQALRESILESMKQSLFREAMGRECALEQLQSDILEQAAVAHRKLEVPTTNRQPPLDSLRIHQLEAELRKANQNLEMAHEECRGLEAALALSEQGRLAAEGMAQAAQTMIAFQRATIESLEERLQLRESQDNYGSRLDHTIDAQVRRGGVR